MMKLVLIGVLLSISIAFAADLVGLEATNSSSAYDFISNSGGLFFPMAAHGDLVVTQGYPDPTNTSEIHFLVFREKDDKYSLVASTPLNIPLFEAFNNGKWMGGLRQDQGLVLFQLDAEDNPVNQTIVEAASGYPYVKLLSDSTIVYLDTGKGISTVASLKFNPNSASWSDGPSFQVLNIFEGSSFPFNSIWIDDNMIVLVNSSFTTFVYSRQTDGSWTLADTFLFNTSLSYGNTLFNLYANGVDTIVFAFAVSTLPGNNFPGYIIVYTKVNNVWQAQVITGADMQLRGASYVGFHSFAAINKDTMVFGAPNENSPDTKKRDVEGYPMTTIPIGRAVVLQRHGDEWVPTAHLQTEDVGFFGAAITATGNNIVVPVVTTGDSISFAIYKVPLCVTRPMEVTCSDQQVSTCQIDADTSNSYTITECPGLNVTASIKRATFKDYAVQVSFEFERALSASYSCDVTVTCPRPPTTTDGVSSASLMTGFSVVALLLLALF